MKRGDDELLLGQVDETGASVAPYAWPPDVRLANKIWFSLNIAAVHLMLAREGVAETAAFMHDYCRRQQEIYFLDGCRRLGIADQPHPRLAAKYHVLSNLLGGLDVAYAEDDQGRAWAVYFAPSAFDAGPFTPSPTLARLPDEIPLAGMRAWHGNNGLMLGNPRLRCVVTHLVSAGAPFDAVYWLEERSPVAEDERFGVELGSASPNEPRTLALSARDWPQERRNKAAIKYAAQYAVSIIAYYAERHGLDQASELAEAAARTVFTSWARPLAGRLRLAEMPAARRMATVVAHSLRLLGDDVETRWQDGSATVILGASRLRTPEYPGWEVLPRPVEAALGRAWGAASAALGPAVTVALDHSKADGSSATAWTFAPRHLS